MFIIIVFFIMKNENLISDKRTIDAYDALASNIAQHLESQDRTLFISRVSQAFKKKGYLLELGCGTGCDSSLLKSWGFEVVATDASAEMLKIAQAKYPELFACLRQLVLPDKIPFPDKTFDGVLAITVLQHLQVEAWLSVLTEIRRVLKIGGRCYIMVFDERNDLDADKRDKFGRLQMLFPSSVVIDMIEQSGLRITREEQVEDALNRKGIVPHEYVCERVN